MAIINCPKCQGKLKFPDDSPPRKVKCPACSHSFLAGPQGALDGSGEKPAAKSDESSQKTPAKKEDVVKDFGSLRKPLAR